MLAWHFTNGSKLRDGSPLPAIGETLRHDGPLVPCESGLHASVRALDALQYAPGTFAHRVSLGGEMLPHGGDKWCASERTILWSVEAEAVLRRFARLCALDVVHLWDAPQVVQDWLPTGDPALRAAAVDAAKATKAAMDAADATLAAWAARAAAVDAAKAARGAARDAAWAAVGAADARGAARDAARDAQNVRLEALLTEAHEASK